MKNCCASNDLKSQKSPRKLQCPNCDNMSQSVSFDTILFHIDSPWLHIKDNKNPSDNNYYFCGNRDCELVYFDTEGNGFNKKQMSKSTQESLFNDVKTICFCYHITEKQIKDKPELKDFVIEQTKSGHCACNIKNPSGLCCLKSFPKN
ncbi:MAG: hypothetical protein OEY19_08275 [Gammaproteobacteria bacterium]|nr:hypothetical protein [Gammaproteobacteria bacterium]MDH5630303.1 hypothetical protein [Gammaproteobacteria bacterium]